MSDDFNWIMSSPSLMNIYNEQDACHWLHSTGDMADNLPATHSLRDELFNYRLGIYYENLVNYILSNLSQPADIYRNIQVKKEKRTLGEFDFLIRQACQNTHLECAVKFYLRTGDGSELCHFIGPGKRDRLDLKWNKMLNQQSQLSGTSEGAKVCVELNVACPVKKLLIQGYLFHPFQQQDCPSLHPDINPQHLKGWWLYAQELSQLGKEGLFVELRKPYWLTLPAEAECLDYAELVERIAEAGSPLLVARVEKGKIGLKELDRGFVVPNHW